jgi:hypothetical protein
VEPDLGIRNTVLDDKGHRSLQHMRHERACLPVTTCITATRCPRTGREQQRVSAKWAALLRNELGCGSKQWSVGDHDSSLGTRHFVEKPQRNQSHRSCKTVAPEHSTIQKCFLPMDIFPPASKLCFLLR